MWELCFHADFECELMALPSAVRIDLMAHLSVLRRFGPALGRPQVDTLKGSRFAGMKELRFRSAAGVWRVAFAFDPTRTAVLLVAADKAGISERLFYRRLTALADQRFARHLDDHQENKGD